jgi:cell division protein FtsL
MTPPAASPRNTRLTGRAAVLAVVICAIALSLAYPVREYISQRRQIGQLETQNQAASNQVKNLQQQQARLSSPSYIEQVARDQLDMCFPGAQCYIVAGQKTSSGGGTQAAQSGSAPWYDKIWQSVQQADTSTAKK